VNAGIVSQPLNTTVSFRKPFKLVKNDGSSVALETFLTNFEKACSFNHWMEEDRVVYLCDALTKSAGDILCEHPDKVTSVYVINILKTFWN